MPKLEIPGHTNQAPREVELSEIQALIGNCRRCSLGDTRKNIVFGSGNPHARVMLIGEAPGKNEDEQGVPFVGAAGQKLDTLLAAAGIARDEVYIANVLKCRPPKNRNPKYDEIVACSPYLREQVRSVWPDVLLCLGNFASQWVLKTDCGVTQLRGKLYQLGHFVVCPTFHPAACIYHREWQPLLEQDLKRVGAWLAEHPAPVQEKLKVIPMAHAADKNDAPAALPKRVGPGVYESDSRQQTEALGELFGCLLEAGDIVVLTGDLGAGKTHFTKGVARGMGASDEVTSPTFTIEMVYEGVHMPLYHFDLYRLDSADQLEDTGLYDALESDGPCLIEWGEQFSDQIGPECIDITITRSATQPAEKNAAGAESASDELAEPVRRIEFSGSSERACELVALLDSKMEA